VAEDQEISSAVISKIKLITGWDTTLDPGTSVVSRAAAHKAGRINVAILDKSTILISVHQMATVEPVLIIDAYGRIVEQLQIDLSGQCRWNTAQSSGGMYLIGSLKTGWTRVCLQR
jgi:hypothetical protein